MSRVLNADDFRDRLRASLFQYHQNYRQALAVHRKRYSATLGQGTDEALEAHVRVYLINEWLTSLNWQVTSSPGYFPATIVPEAPVRSSTRHTIRFMDYLGVEANSGIPLLIVETKHPAADLPATPCTPQDIQAGLGGKIISVAEWNKWLADLTDYVLSVKKQSKVFPKRVVLTNGHWLILFNDPENAFTQKNLCDPRHIRIYSEPQALIDQAADLYRSLEHQTVLGEVPHLQTGELPFYVPAGAVDRLMHGLHVIHNETTTFEEAAPVIYVRPILLARSGTGAWICIKATDSFPLPDRAKDLAEHLAKVDSCAKALFADVVRALALPETTTCASLVSHYKTDDNVRMLPGFREIRSLATGLSRQFLILTGEHTHYLLSSPTVADCPFHEWSTCARNHTAAGTRPILVKTTVPHSFFVSGTDHHCAHMQVYRAKASPVLADNRSYTGPRSAEDGGAFCELWPLEQYLCCRSCVFQNVCTASSLFHLPCSRVL